MAKRKRNYKAEYARRKALAIEREYKSPREEYQARKRLGLTRGFPSLKRSELPDFVIEHITGARMARIRRESQEWSNKHSHVKASRYRRNMSNRQVEAYHRAYVQRVTEGSRRRKAIEKRLRIYEYLIAFGYPVEGGPEAWKSDPQPA